MSDDQIDYSDAPPVPDTVWAKTGKLPEPKQENTLRIDGEMLEFFRQTGNRYQARIYAVMRSFV